MQQPQWRGSADAWFKLLGAVVFGYLILSHAVVLLRQFAGPAIVLVGSVLLAYIVLPAVDWLRRRMPTWAALTVVYLVGALVLAGIAEVLVPIASQQFASLLRHVPEMQVAVERFVADPHNALVRHLPGFMQSWVMKLPDQVAVEFQRNAMLYSSSIVNALGTLTFLGALAIAIPVVSIYLLAEAPLIRAFAIRRVPPRYRAGTFAIVNEIDAVLGGFVRGQLIVAAAVGTLTTIALAILHVPYAVLIGAWAGIADVVPYVGPFAGGIPAAIVAVTANGWGSLIALGIAFFAINQLEGHLLAPRIVSRTVRITPLGVIFALLIGAQLFGFVGLIVAVPLAGIVRVALVHIFPQREPRASDAGTALG